MPETKKERLARKKREKERLAKERQARIDKRNAEREASKSNLAGFVKKLGEGIAANRAKSKAGKVDTSTQSKPKATQDKAKTSQPTLKDLVSGLVETVVNDVKEGKNLKDIITPKDTVTPEDTISALTSPLVSESVKPKDVSAKVKPVQEKKGKDLSTLLSNVTEAQDAFDNIEHVVSKKTKSVERYRRRLKNLNPESKVYKRIQQKLALEESRLEEANLIKTGQPLAEAKQAVTKFTSDQKEKRNKDRIEKKGGIEAVKSANRAKAESRELDLYKKNPELYKTIYKRDAPLGVEAPQVSTTPAQSVVETLQKSADVDNAIQGATNTGDLMKALSGDNISSAKLKRVDAQVFQPQVLPQATANIPSSIIQPFDKPVQTDTAPQPSEPSQPGEPLAASLARAPRSQIGEIRRAETVPVGITADITTEQVPQVSKSKIELERIGQALGKGFKGVSKTLAQPETQKLLADIAMALTASRPESGQFQLGKAVSESAEGKIYNKFVSDLEAGKDVTGEGLSPELQTLGYQQAAAKKVFGLEKKKVDIAQQKANTELLSISTKAQEEINKKADAKTSKQATVAYNIIESAIKKVPGIIEDGEFSKEAYQAYLLGGGSPITEDLEKAMKGAIDFLKTNDYTVFGLDDSTSSTPTPTPKPSTDKVIDISGMSQEEVDALNLKPGTIVIRDGKKFKKK